MAPMKKNHNPQCTRDHRGLSKSSEIAGVNLNSHEQDHAQKTVYFAVDQHNGVSELHLRLEGDQRALKRRHPPENAREVVTHLEQHPVGTIDSCHTSLWLCGRCFCLKPTIRVFDLFGRVDVVFLGSVVDAAVRRSEDQRLNRQDAP